MEQCDAALVRLSNTHGLSGSLIEVIDHSQPFSKFRRVQWINVLSSSLICLYFDTSKAMIKPPDYLIASLANHDALLRGNIDLIKQHQFWFLGIGRH